jgi:hypothetical protein
MKILYLLKQEPNATLQSIVEEHKKEHEVQIVDIRNEKDYARIVDLIAGCDKVISW